MGRRVGGVVAVCGVARGARAHTHAHTHAAGARRVPAHNTATTPAERAAANQERELDSILTAMVGLLGPLLIIAMGVFVLLIVFAMLLPIFEMNTLIR